MVVLCVFVCVCLCPYVCVRGGEQQFNVVSVPRASGSFRRVSTARGDDPLPGKWHRESIHIYTDIFDITYGYVNRPDPTHSSRS